MLEIFAKKNRKINSRGFSLIEIIIVISIIGTLTTASLIFMGNIRTEKAVKSEVTAVLAVIREAQNYSLTGRGAHPSCGNVFEFHYGQENNGTNNPSAFGIGGCTDFAHELKSGISFSASDYFSFIVPHGRVLESDGTALLPGETITITISKSGVTGGICVYPSGRVNEQEDGSSC